MQNERKATEMDYQRSIRIYTIIQIIAQFAIVIGVLLIIGSAGSLENDTIGFGQCLAQCAGAAGICWLGARTYEYTDITLHNLRRAMERQARLNQRKITQW